MLTCTQNTINTLKINLFVVVEKGILGISFKIILYTNTQFEQFPGTPMPSTLPT